MSAIVTIALSFGLQAFSRRHCSSKLRIRVRLFSTRSRLMPRAGESISFPHSTAFEKIDLSMSSSRLTVAGWTGFGDRF